MTKAQAKSNEQKAALAKIQKLLALAARPGTPAEGERAMERAQALASKHGFTIRKVPVRRVVAVDDILSRYMRETDRTAAERAVKKHKTEQRRKRTMAERAYTFGWDAAQSGELMSACPYEREVVFGVSVSRWWRVGYEDGRHGRFEFDKLYAPVT